MKKVVIRQPRHIAGVYHEASAANPKVIEVPDELDTNGMELHKEGMPPPTPTPVKQAFNDGPKTHVQSSAQVHSKSDAEKAQDKAHHDKHGGKPKRAADHDPA